MQLEIIIPIICCCSVIIIVGIYSYVYKRITGKEDNAINFISILAINIIAEYVNKNAKKDAKKFDNFNDYIINLREYLLESIKQYVESNKENVPSYVTKLIDNESINEIINDLIAQEIDFLEEAFTSTKKTSKKSK